MSTQRKCFASVTSSLASIYLISAFFAVSFFSLLYIKYPPQSFNHFDYLRIIKLNPTAEPPITGNPTASLSDNDFTTPSVSLLDDGASSPVATPSETSELPTPPAESSNPTAVVQEESPAPVVDTSEPPATPVVEEANTRDNNNQVPSSETPVSETEKKSDNDKEGNPPIADRMMVPQPSAVNEKTEKIDEDEDEDESAVLAVDHLSYPPVNFTMEERMAWIKQKLPESKVLESTPASRKFEQKIQEYASAKKCSVSIYMTWISTTRFMGKRELFSLESVVKEHPGACVFLVSRIMASKRGKEIIQPLVDRGHLIHPVVPDFTLLFSGTPAQDWLDKLKEGQVDPGKIPITQNLSNLLRLVILHKYGGIYLDTDMIILKDLRALRNSIGVQEVDAKTMNWVSVNNAVLIFDKGHPLLLRFMEEFTSSFDGNVWGYNGPYMATRVIKKLVNDENYQFNIMSRIAFYPVDWFHIHRLFRDPYPNDDTKWSEDMSYKVTHQSYGVHLWNKVSSPLKIEKGSVIGKLISNHCILCKDKDVYDNSS